MWHGEWTSSDSCCARPEANISKILLSIVYCSMKKCQDCLYPWQKHWVVYTQYIQVKLCMQVLTSQCLMCTPAICKKRERAVGNIALLAVIHVTGTIWQRLLHLQLGIYISNDSGNKQGLRIEIHSLSPKQILSVWKVSGSVAMNVTNAYQLCK